MTTMILMMKMINHPLMILKVMMILIDFNKIIFHFN
jgi:hypothetical protein